METDLWLAWSWGKQGWGDELARGLAITLALALCSLLLGGTLGLLGAGIYVSRWQVARLLIRSYSIVMRALPELLILFLIFYGVGTWLRLFLDTSWGTVEISSFLAGVIALSLVNAAYASELFRGAILAIPREQLDAGRALGMGSSLLTWHIVLPQMFRRAWAGIGNLWQMLLKDTALVSVIGLGDLMRIGSMAARATHNPFVFYFAVALIYLVLTALSSWLFRIGEAKLTKYN